MEAERAKAEKEQASKEKAKRAEEAAAARAEATREAAMRREAKAKASTGPSPSHLTRAGRSAGGTTSGGLTVGDGLSSGLELQLGSLGGVLSDDYLHGLSIDSGDAPNFFQDRGERTSSMGPPPSRGGGARDGAPSERGGSGSGGAAGGSGSGRVDGAVGTQPKPSVSGGSAGGAGGYFNPNELSELFSIIHGKRKNSAGSPSGADGARRGATTGGGGPSPRGGAMGVGGVPGAFDSFGGLPEHLRTLPPIRTKSMENQNRLGPEVVGGIPMPGSGGRLVTGLTPHGILSGSGLTPTGLTPGSLLGEFPGMVDSFAMALGGDGDGGLPGWTSTVGGMDGGGLGGPDGMVSGAAAAAAGGKGGKKRKAGGGLAAGGGAKASKAAKGADGSKKGKAGAGAKAWGKAKANNNDDDDDDDDDDMPLSGLIPKQKQPMISGAAGAEAAAKAAAAKLGITLPPGGTAALSSGVNGDDDEDEDGDEMEGGEKKNSNKSRSRSWLPEEDELVRNLVAQHGPRKWTLIATRLKTKTQKQVYARWRDYLQPGLTTKPWTKEEQAKLVELQAHVGNQWAVLARLMPGRSPNAIKNRFHATKRKMERHIKRDGSNLAPPGQGPKAAAAAGGAAKGKAGAAKGAKASSGAGAVSDTNYSQDEVEAVEGLLLADTPTSLVAMSEKEAAQFQFDAAADAMEAGVKADAAAGAGMENAETAVEDRIAEEAAKVAKAAALAADKK